MSLPAHVKADAQPQFQPRIQPQVQRDDSSKLETIVVGAGLGGLGAAIGILLAGHAVTVLESASAIGEVGAGIQVLPNSARVLRSWGLEDALRPWATAPRGANYFGWKGNHISSMDFDAYAKALNAPFWDFHRANLHKCLLDRAVELGATIKVNSRVENFVVSEDGLSATVLLANGTSMTADLVVGADGIDSRLREALLGHPDPPVRTGDLAYRLLLNTKDMMADPELRPFIEDPQTNYWIGPDAHCVNYVLKGGELFNMVLLVPDDMPDGGPSTLVGSVDEMRALFKDWDPRIGKMLGLCQSVLKWRLCIRPTLEPTWSHPSGTVTLLGDAVHATLPYLASGAGMALEDAGVLGLCLAKLTDKSAAAKKQALRVYEDCRRERTERVVARGSYNQEMYHLHDGEQQRTRDKLFKEYDAIEKEWLSEPTPRVEVCLETGEDPFPWRRFGVGRWLLTYEMAPDVEEKWAAMVAREGAK
ncbi:FAD/NAD(P)-binding domain-containing protein [Coniochaeta ligniaria NRRL 30616]|uniref:FAD/NAD(P)-binding domain-containing protein n=1 Tax=Coniochaeta ligniaria NRRL 30616 TaxID=1408157 RepID=A0A1J7ICK1_9PEZI|nr:FAD/NAD(P)-binding domain-containing protein [Coniochaeta ligniaria NRRL 30616]